MSVSAALSRRQRQALVLLADAGEPCDPGELKRLAALRWGQGAWKFGAALRELALADWVARVGEGYRITGHGLRGIGRDPRDASPGPAPATRDASPLAAAPSDASHLPAGATRG